MAEQQPKPKHKEVAAGMLVIGNEQFVLSKADGMKEVWALHEMGGMQPRVGWIGCVHESMGYLADARTAPKPDSQWIFGYQSLQAAAESLVAEKLAFGADPEKVRPERSRIEQSRVCDKCGRGICVVTTSHGQTVFCERASSVFIDLDGHETLGNLIHDCKRK